MLEHAAVSGNPKDGVYSQTLVSGNFFVVLSLEGSAVSLELGRNVLTKIEEVVTQTPSISPKELVEIEKSEFGADFKLNILVAWIDNQTLKLAGEGNVGAKLIRKGKIINLSAPNLTGTLLHGDMLILGTLPFFATITPDEFVTNGSPIGEIRDRFLPKIESATDNSHIAALTIKIALQDESALSEEPVVLVEPVLPTPPPRHLYLHRPASFRLPINLANRKLLYLLLLVSVFLVSLVVFQLRSKVLEQQNKVIQNLESQVTDGVNNAHKLTGLNDQLARGLLLQTRNDFVSKADAAFGKTWPARLQKDLASLDSELGQVSHVYSLSSLDVFYDFSLLKANAKISSAWSHKDEVVALDTGNGAVYSLHLETKGAAIVIGNDDLKSGKYLDFAGSSVYVWTPTGIIAIDRGISPATAKTLLKSSDKWGRITDLRAFAGNIYLLDSPNNQIWKYQKTDLGFADISPYLTAHSVDFANVNQMAIEGSVLVLTTTGNIVQFSSGSPVNFEITGLDGGLKSPLSFFTSDETDNIYVLDSSGKRVVVITKKGLYLSQYLLPNSFSTLVADEKLKKVFLFSEAKVSVFDLK